jgi:uncharacterized LabA/DUF88 family protein
VHNAAFIDGQNLYSGIQSLGWSLDLRQFRVHLAQKYHVTRACYFLGYMPTNQRLYQRLQAFGYELWFKPVVQGQAHDPKGNVDTDLVLRAVVDLPTYDQAVIVAGDGDYYSLVDHLAAEGKLFAVLAPNRRYCSSLLRRSAKGKLRYIEDVRHLVERTR